MMRKLIITLGITVCALSSCAKEWSDTDQKMFMDNCLQYAPEDNKEVCSCGLEKAMEKYSTLEEAQDAMDNMTDAEAVEFLAECL